jgi:hypothetical protein
VINVEVIRRVEAVEERGHLGGIAVPGGIQLLLDKSAGDLRRGRVHRKRAGMRDRIGDTEVIAWHEFVPFLMSPGRQEHARVLARDRFKPVADRVALGNALLPAAADPMHRDRQTLGQSANCHMMTAHHPTQCRATEIEYAGSLLSGWGAQ